MKFRKKYYLQTPYEQCVWSITAPVAYSSQLSWEPVPDGIRLEDMVSGDSIPQIQFSSSFAILSSITGEEEVVFQDGAEVNFILDTVDSSMMVYYQSTNGTQYPIWYSNNGFASTFQADDGTSWVQSTLQLTFPEAKIASSTTIKWEDYTGLCATDIQITYASCDVVWDCPTGTIERFNAVLSCNYNQYGKIKNTHKTIEFVSLNATNSNSEVKND